MISFWAIQQVTTNGKLGRLPKELAERYPKRTIGQIAEKALKEG